MILTVELQCQFPVGDVPSGAVKRGGVLSALTLAEDEVAVGGTAESGGAGDHVHGIIVIHLPQMMHQQNGDESQEQADRLRRGWLPVLG